MAVCQVDQGYRIVQVLGHPTLATWPTGHLSAVGIKVPAGAATHLAAVVPKATAPQLSLLLQLLQWDPYKRPSAHHALEHACFADTVDVCDLDPRNKRRSVTHASIHAHHIDREVSEVEGGRMTSFAAAMMTLKAVNKFKQFLPRFRTKARNVRAATNMAALAEAKVGRASVFDMEAAMDAIANEMGVDDAVIAQADARASVGTGARVKTSDASGDALAADQYQDGDDDFHRRFAAVSAFGF
jgi:hypothetical protein